MLDKNEWIRPWAGSDDEVTKMLDIKLIRENPDKIKHLCHLIITARPGADPFILIEH